MSPYFTILVNQTGEPTRYLYDPHSIGSEALSFTDDPAQSLVFSLTRVGQLTFNVTDIFGRNVSLLSEQDIQVS